MCVCVRHNRLCWVGGCWVTVVGGKAEYIPQKGSVVDVFHCSPTGVKPRVHIELETTGIHESLHNSDSIKILHFPINDYFSLHFGFAICCSPLNILTVLLSLCDRSLLYYSFICLTLFYVLYTTWKAPQVFSVYQMFYINNTALFKALKIMVVLKLH